LSSNILTINEGVVGYFTVNVLNKQNRLTNTADINTTSLTVSKQFETPTVLTTVYTRMKKNILGIKIN